MLSRLIIRRTSMPLGFRYSWTKEMLPRRPTSSAEKATKMMALRCGRALSTRASSSRAATPLPLSLAPGAGATPSFWSLPVLS